MADASMPSTARGGPPGRISVCSGVRAVLDWPPRRLTSWLSSRTMKFALYSSAVGNCRRTGGGNWLTPEADLTDGLLDLCIVREMSRA